MGSTLRNDELALAERLVARDPSAYEAVVSEHGPMMYRVAHRLLQNDAEAADAVQDAFVSVIRAITSFRGESSLATWLYRITVNAARARLRKISTSRHVPIEDLLPRFYKDGHRVDPGQSWLELIDRRREHTDLQEEILAALTALPPDARVVLVLRDLEMLSTDATSDILQIEPGAVRTRLHRARQALRAVLVARLEGGGS